MIITLVHDSSYPQVLSLECWKLEIWYDEISPSRVSCRDSNNALAL